MTVKSTNGPIFRNEPFLTIPAAAIALGLKYHALLRAVKLGLVPSYRPFGSRAFVLLSEVASFVKAHQSGGPHDG